MIDYGYSFVIFNKKKKLHLKFFKFEMIFFKINLFILIIKLSLTEEKEKSTSTLIQISVPLNYLELSTSQIKLFEHEKSGGYANLLLRKKSLYLSGINYVFKLDALNINSKVETFYKEREIKPTSKPLLGHESFSNSSNRINNYIKFLTFRDATKDMIVCGTNLGRPHIYDLKKSDLSNQFEYNGDFLCPGVEDLNNLNKICIEKPHLSDSNNSTKKSIMYSAIWITKDSSDTYGIFSRYGIFRKDIEVNQNFVRSIFSPFWFWEPNFVQIIEDEKFVYYFFTEFSLEKFSLDYPKVDMSSFNELSLLTLKINQTLPRFSRVARVCKNDKGAKNEETSEFNKMWTTFRKVRLQCKCSNLKLANDSKHFNYLYESHVYSMDFNNLVFVKQLDNITRKILGVFHEKIPNIYKPIDEDLEIVSVLCEFDFEAMRIALETKQFWQREVNPDEIHFSQNDFGCEEEISSKEELEEDLEVKQDENKKLLTFLSKHSILNSILVGECKIILPYKITSLTYEIKEHSTGNNLKEAIFYLSTSTAKIIRITRKTGDYQVLSVVSFDDLSQNRNLTKRSETNCLMIKKSFNEILFNFEEKILYLTTDECILQLNITEITDKICKNYAYCSNCLSDPYCKWTYSANRTNCHAGYDESYRNINQCDTPHQTDLSSGSVTKINSNFIYLEAEFGKSLIINCADYLNDGNKEANSILVERLNWLKNDLKIVKNSNERVSRYGELILINVNNTNSAIYYCKLDTLEELLVVNLTIKSSPSKNQLNDVFSSTKIVPQSSKVNIEEISPQGNQLWTFLDDWKHELNNYQIKMNEYERLFNETLECEC